MTGCRRGEREARVREGVQRRKGKGLKIRTVKTCENRKAKMLQKRKRRCEFGMKGDREWKMELILNMRIVLTPG